MPVVNVDLGWLNRLLGQQLPPEAVQEALEQIGCDVEEIVEVTRCSCPSCGALVESSMGAPDVRSCPYCGHGSDQPFPIAARLAVVRLDLLAARPDLFDVGGLARALRGYLDIEVGLPGYTVFPGTLTVRVAPELSSPESFRPFIRCAAVILPPIDEAALVAIMKLQESLHWGIGRDRKLASIGVYDLDTVEGDIDYRTLDPDGERFEPLGMPGALWTARQVLAEHPKGKAYSHLLDRLTRYPVLADARGRILSIPPILNSEPTKVKLGSRRLFVDVTGISETAVVKSLCTLVCSLLELGGRCESVRIVGPQSTIESPDLAPRRMVIDLTSARACLGVPLEQTVALQSLRRMRFDASPTEGEGELISVSFPAFRTDVRHAVDLFEDLAIGFGYRNLEPRLVHSLTVSEPRAEELLSETTRTALFGLGFAEVMSLPLQTEEDHFLRFRLSVPEAYPRVANPKSPGLTVVRTHLLTGLLKALQESRRRSLPLQLFELDDVVALDEMAETGARTERRLAFVEMGRETGYAALRAVLDSVLRELGQTAVYTPADDPTFLIGRCASFVTTDGRTGRLGELHPEVILAFGLDHPVTAAELTLQGVV